MSNQITYSSVIHPLADILDTCGLIFSSCSPCTVHANLIILWHLTPLQVITTRAREGNPKEDRANKNCDWNSFSNICTRNIHSFLSFPYYRAASTVIPLLPRPPSPLPSSLTSAYLISVLHLLLPSTPFWSYGTHPFFPDAQTISIFSNALYSLTPFLFQLSDAP